MMPGCWRLTGLGPVRGTERVEAEPRLPERPDEPPERAEEAEDDRVVRARAGDLVAMIARVPAGYVTTR